MSKITLNLIGLRQKYPGEVDIILKKKCYWTLEIIDNVQLSPANKEVHREILYIWKGPVGQRRWI